MTHRERVLAALNHQETARVPVDLGGTRDTTIHWMAYEALKTRLGIRIATKPRLTSRMMQVVAVDEEVLRHLDVDTRYVGPGERDEQSPAQAVLDSDADAYADEWGVVRRRPPGGHWYDLAFSPLADAETVAEIARYPWPDPHDPGLVREIPAQIAALRRETDCAIVLGLPPAFVHVSQYMRGFEQWFVDTVRNRRLLGALFDAIMEVQMALADDMLAASGGDFDVVMTADDIAGQYGPLISLPAYRELIKPRQARYFDFIRSQTSAPFLYHSCGSMYDLLEDLIDIGVQAITPVQVSAAKMEPARLKQEFGDRLAFWGGVDTQWLLPFGTPQDVRHGVRELVETLGAGGGFVLAAVHNIQPEVPVQNICAMFEAAGIDCNRQ